MTKKKVIVAGHICLDITPVFTGDKIRHAGELLSPGKLIHVKEADVHTGGAVANTGLAMKILGADVTLMGKVGNDEFGKMVRNILKNYDADQEMIVSETDSTSYSVVLAMPGLDRIFLHNPGANDTFTGEEIPTAKLEQTALIHFGYPPLMKKMYENDGEALITLMKRAHEAGTATSLDLAAVDPSSEAGRADWEKILKETLPYVDFFVPSVEELCYMLDRDTFEKWQERSRGQDITECMDIEEDVRPLAWKCMEMGAKVLLIKCGAQGMYYCTSGKERLRNIGKNLALNPDEWAEKEGFEYSYVPDCLLSGTGAGDTSIAAFLSAMLEGYPPEKCMQLAAATGASCVAAYDALSGLKSFEELNEKISKGWEKQTERSGKSCL